MLISPPSEDLGLREQEAAAIDSFVTDFLNNSIAGCRFLMVPGHHGLGKSTVVHSVLQNRNI
jgi:Cdc6-like AAA superfamily ATPase